MADHADGVIFLYREKIYDPNSLRIGEVQLLISRNKHGRVGSISIAANFKTGRLLDLSMRTSDTEIANDY
jgi:replicative DNA helicase